MNTIDLSKHISLINGNPHKKILDLKKSNVTDDLLKVYAQQLDQQINEIIINDNKITSRGMQYLSQCSFPHLTQIYLNKNRIGNQGCKILSKTNWNRLTYLCLNQNSINQVGIHHLSKANWRSLQSLVLMRNNIGAKAFSSLNKSSFHNLQILTLTNKYVNPGELNVGNDINFCEALQIILSEFKKLTMIWLNGQNFTKENISYLKRIVKDKKQKGIVMLN